jgi:hypothetical protein
MLWLVARTNSRASCNRGFGMACSILKQYHARSGLELMLVHPGRCPGLA